MIPIDVLARPMLDLLGAFGSGVLPAGGPADALRASSVAIDAVHDTGRTGISAVYGDWEGRGGTGAIVKTEEAQRSTVAVADRGNDMAAVVAEASEIVRAGMAQLQEILQSFLSLAIAAGPALATPPGQAMIIAAAIDHLGRATTVVAAVRTQLSEQTARMVELTPAEDTPTAPAATAPASTSAASTVAASATPVSRGRRPDESRGVRIREFVERAVDVRIDESGVEHRLFGWPGREWEPIGFPHGQFRSYRPRRRHFRRHPQR
jgi:hypothetical protein